MKPTVPNPAVASTAIQTYEFFRSAHRSVGMITAPRISTPPMVGVPALA
jgi:hypothetical protein